VTESAKAWGANIPNSSASKRYLRRMRRMRRPTDLFWLFRRKEIAFMPDELL
jgi:hypothetical protein